MNNLQTQNGWEFIAQYSDALVNRRSITLPPKDVGEYVVSSIDEFKERHDLNTFIEVKLSNQQIDVTESVESFLAENGNKYEIHRIFEINEPENLPKYVTSFLVIR